MAKKVKQPTEEEIAEQKRELFRKIEDFFIRVGGTSEYTQEVMDASETWYSATNNGGDTCGGEGFPVWEFRGLPTHFMVSSTLATLMGLLDEGYPGKEIFRSLGFKH